MIANFSSLADFNAAFPTEKACIKHLEKLRWSNKVVSPFDETSKVYKCKDNKYFCNNTKKYFNVKTKTLFDNTKVPLKKWFIAIWLSTAHKKGISSCQLARDIHVTQKTAWFMLQRIRVCFEEDPPPLEGTVEIDETFVGGKNKNRHKDKKVKKCQGRSYKDKVPVFGMLERNGRLIAKVVKNTKASTLLSYIKGYVKEGTIIYSDEWNYGDIDKYYIHASVNHAGKLYGYGDVHTNTIEGFWGIFKRGIIGIYNKVSKKHLQKYVDEFVFRYNTRKICETQRFNLFLYRMERRLKYEDLIYGW